MWKIFYQIQHQIDNILYNNHLPNGKMSDSDWALFFILIGEINEIIKNHMRKMKFYKTPTNWKTKYYCHDNMTTSNNLKKNIDNFFPCCIIVFKCGTNQSQKEHCTFLCLIKVMESSLLALTENLHQKVNKKLSQITLTM